MMPNSSSKNNETGIIPGATETPADLEDKLLPDLMRMRPQEFGEILKDPRKYRVQIIYTQIDRKADNQPVFHDHYFNLDTGLYFYPASTVKMPISLLALQRLRELNIPGLDRNSAFITEAAYSGQTPVYNDPSAADGKPSIGQYVKKIFLVSDNDAFNRLYEFLGQEYINEQLRIKGYSGAEIIHRLSLPLNADENRHTNPVSFLDRNGKRIYQQPLQESRLMPLLRSEQMGSGYMQGGKLIREPFDFSRKNRLYLEDLHQILRSVIFPDAVPASRRFNLSKEDYRFIRKYMAQYPAESDIPEYSDTSKYRDAYCKFLYWGSVKGSLPKSLRIFNKVGDAYGFLTDVAYVVDFDRRIEFMLSATIYCNSNGIFNDDKYDYDSVGFPFMKNLGRTIYDYERKRKKARFPNLSTFRDEIQK